MNEPFDTANQVFSQIASAAGCSESAIQEIHTLVQCLQGLPKDTKTNINLAMGLLGYCEGGGGGGSTVDAVQGYAETATNTTAIANPGKIQVTLHNSTDKVWTVTVAGSSAYRIAPNASLITLFHDSVAGDDIVATVLAGPITQGELTINVETV